MKMSLDKVDFGKEEMRYNAYWSSMAHLQLDIETALEMEDTARAYSSGRHDEDILNGVFDEYLSDNSIRQYEMFCNDFNRPNVYKSRPF